MIVVSQSGETADTLAALRYAKRARPAHSLDRQRRDLDHRARERHGGADPGGAGNRRRLDQGFYLPARGLRLSRPGAGAGARRAEQKSGRRSWSPNWSATPGLMAEVLKSRGAAGAGGARRGAGLERVVSGARAGFSAGAGRRAKTQGIVLYPRRRLCRRRTEARADRADRLRHAGDRAGAAGRVSREDRLEPARSRGARRSSHPHRLGRTQERRRRPNSPASSRCPRARPAPFAALVYAMPVQLLAYHVAVFMGKDVDQPRNLAKSVTVE